MHGDVFNMHKLADMVAVLIEEITRRPDTDLGTEGKEIAEDEVEHNLALLLGLGGDLVEERRRDIDLGLGYYCGGHGGMLCREGTENEAGVCLIYEL